MITLAGFMLLAILILQIPVVKAAASWRYEKFTLYVKNVIDPPGPEPITAISKRTFSVGAVMTL